MKKVLEVVGIVFCAVCLGAALMYYKPSSLHEGVYMVTEEGGSLSPLGLIRVTAQDSAITNAELLDMDGTLIAIDEWNYALEIPRCEDQSTIYYITFMPDVPGRNISYRWRTVDTKNTFITQVLGLALSVKYTQNQLGEWNAEALSVGTCTMIERGEDFTFVPVGEGSFMYTIDADGNYTTNKDDVVYSYTIAVRKISDLMNGWTYYISCDANDEIIDMVEVRGVWDEQNIDQPVERTGSKEQPIKFTYTVKDLDSGRLSATYNVAYFKDSAGFLNYTMDVTGKVSIPNSSFRVWWIHQEDGSTIRESDEDGLCGATVYVEDKNTKLYSDKECHNPIDVTFTDLAEGGKAEIPRDALGENNSIWWKASKMQSVTMTPVWTVDVMELDKTNWLENYELSWSVEDYEPSDNSDDYIRFYIVCTTEEEDFCISYDFPMELAGTEAATKLKLSRKPSLIYYKAQTPHSPCVKLDVNSLSGWMSRKVSMKGTLKMREETITRIKQ